MASSFRNSSFCSLISKISAMPLSIAPMPMVSVSTCEWICSDVSPSSSDTCTSSRFRMSVNPGISGRRCKLIIVVSLDISAPSRMARCWSSEMRASSISADTAASSSGLADAVSSGAAFTNVPLFCATPNAAATSGRLSSFTVLCASPTLLNEIQPTRLAAIVSPTALPIAKYSCVDMR